MSLGLVSVVTLLHFRGGAFAASISSCTVLCLFFAFKVVARLLQPWTLSSSLFVEVNWEVQVHGTLLLARLLGKEHTGHMGAIYTSWLVVASLGRLVQLGLGRGPFVGPVQQGRLRPGRAPVFSCNFLSLVELELRLGVLGRFGFCRAAGKVASLEIFMIFCLPCTSLVL